MSLSTFGGPYSLTFASTFSSSSSFFSFFFFCFVASGFCLDGVYNQSMITLL